MIESPGPEGGKQRETDGHEPASGSHGIAVLVLVLRAFTSEHVTLAFQAARAKSLNLTDFAESKN